MRGIPLIIEIVYFSNDHNFVFRGSLIFVLVRFAYVSKMPKTNVKLRLNMKLWSFEKYTISIIDITPLKGPLSLKK